MVINYFDFPFDKITLFLLCSKNCPEEWKFWIFSEYDEQIQAEKVKLIRNLKPF